LEVPVFRGAEDDVLDRITRAAEQFDAAVIVRLTADCPMIDPALIDETIEAYMARDCDYASNGHVRSYPDGMDVEVISYQALAQADKEATHSFLREHVTPYIRASHPQYGSGVFKIENVIFETDYSSVRWTLDTQDDLAVIRELCAKLPDGFTWQQALDIANSEPELLNLKTHQVKS